MKINYLQTITISIFALFLMACGSGQETDNAQVQADISPVIPKVNGSVLAVRVGDNERVEAGDTLALLDSRDYVLRVHQAEIALEQALANVSLAQKTSRSATVGTAPVAELSGVAVAGIAAAQEGVRATEVRVRQATLNFNRQAQLLAQQSTPQVAYDNAKADKEGAEAALRIAQAQVTVGQRQAAAASKQVTSAQTQAGLTTDGIRLAELAVKQARFTLDAARLQHSYTVILAPAAGIVADKSVQVGQVVAPGQTLMKIANDRQLWVVANFKETQLETMHVGQLAEVEVDAYPDKVFNAKIESLAPATGARFALLPPDNATGNFVKVTQRVPVKITLLDPADAATPLRADMSAKVTVPDTDNVHEKPAKTTQTTPSNGRNNG